MINPLIDYQDVECPFCKVTVGQPCVKVYGKNAGQVADWPHTKRAYKYWRKQRMMKETNNG